MRPVLCRSVRACPAPSRVRDPRARISACARPYPGSSTPRLGPDDEQGVEPDALRLTAGENPLLLDGRSYRATRYRLDRLSRSFYA